MDNTNNDHYHYRAADGNITHLRGGPPASATASRTDTDHYNTVYELRVLTSTTTTSPTIPSPTTRIPAFYTTTESSPATAPPFCGRRPRPGTSAWSGTPDGGPYIDIDEVGISTTTTSYQS
ncbi:uncharacterized protein LOC143286374 [Babylonia areolata]|uniref:uncharacterized protein LOC143286374 n=1 Tax=Babylonia areolata TaxID=304850 RepID=UPI003FD3EE68